MHLITASYYFFLEEIDSLFYDLQFHTEMRWLSFGNVLFRFYTFRREINIYPNEKYRTDPLLSEPET